MNKKKSVDDDSRTIGFRVHPSLYEWIKAQAVDGESPHQVVRRLIQGLAVGDGVTPNSSTKNFAFIDIGAINDCIDERVNQRVSELETVMATFQDDLKRLNSDVAKIKH